MSNTEYIEVIEGKYKGYRGYIKRILNGEQSPNECMVYEYKDKNGNATTMVPFKPMRVYLKDSEIKRIK